MRKNKLSAHKQALLIEHLVVGATARCAAIFARVDKTTAAYYFYRLREIIACHLESKLHEFFEDEIRVYEIYFGGRRKNKYGGVVQQKKYL